MKSNVSPVTFLVPGICISILWVAGCTSWNLDNWTVSFPSVGTYSSCRAVDLNGDHILDLVLGGAAKEYEATATGVIALDGNDGSLLWKYPARNQMVGSAIFHDLDQDGGPDVVIGGRSAQLVALNGRNGEKLWEFLSDHPELDLVNDTTLLNFFTPQWVPDQDGDAVPDILTAFGGFVNAGPEETDRPAGKLMVIGGATGSLLAEAPMPDGKETYCAPVLLQSKNDLNPYVIYGSGGETINGGLFVTTLRDIMQGDLKNSKQLADGEGKGFIAPPLLADITSDKVPDIIAQSFNGRMMAFDGQNFASLWSYRVTGGVETYSIVAPIDYNKDGTLDFFGSYGIGSWPDIKRSVQVVVNGKTGEPMMSDSLGTFQYASPLSFDFTDDGNDDVLFTINRFSSDAWNGDLLENEKALYRYTNELIVYDIVNGTTYQLGENYTGTNLGSTPLLVDLDNDDKLDIITCHMADAFDFFSFKGLTITRTELGISSGRIPLGAYMGNDFDGNYNQRID